MTTEEWKEWYAREPEKAMEYYQQQKMIYQLRSSSPESKTSLGENYSPDTISASGQEDDYSLSKLDGDEPSTEASLSDGEGSEELSKKDMASLGLQAGALGLKAYQGSKQMQDRREQARYESQLKRNLAMQNAAGSGHNWFR